MKSDSTNSGSSSIRQLRRLYLIIVISIITFLVIQQSLLSFSTSESRIFTKHLNIAGRQRMLSQKIAKLALLCEKDRTHTDELLTTLKEWNDDYDDLINGNSLRDLEPLDDHTVYEKMRVADSFHRQMSAAVQNLVGGRSRDHALHLILRYESLFLKHMETTMSVYEKKAQKSISRIETVEYAMCIIAIIMILLEMYYVFEPTTDIIADQENMLREKIRDLKDSMTYAKKVQETILPAQREFSKSFSESFILYLPKDIIAGDFYFLESLNSDSGDVTLNTADEDLVLIAVCDCTGHGIPGAMVSLICHNAIEQAVKNFNLRDPALILDKVNELVRLAFSREDTAIMDGMDVSICCLKRSSGLLCWAGANIPLWLLRNGEQGAELIELKPDKQPIGRFVTNKPFTNHTVKVNPGDSIFLFSDGYSDQFGGEKGKKFKTRQFQQLLIDNYSSGLDATHQALQDALAEWKGVREQVDDITVMGIRV